MELEKFRLLVKKIVEESNNLKNQYTNERNAPVNYACIFCQNEVQYRDFVALANELGTVIKETSTGLLFNIKPLETISGKLKLLKIRKPDVTRPEKGDADFTVLDYKKFKKKFLKQKEFSLIVREFFEMIELVDPSFKVRTYFSNPPLDHQLGI